MTSGCSRSACSWHGSRRTPCCRTPCCRTNGLSTSACSTSSTASPHHFDLPVLRRSAILALPRCRFDELFPQRGTISPRSLRRPHLPLRHHGGVVGKPQSPPARLGQLALLGRKPPGALHDLEAAREQVVDHVSVQSARPGRSARAAPRTEPGAARDAGSGRRRTRAGRPPTTRRRRPPPQAARHSPSPAARRRRAGSRSTPSRRPAAPRAPTASSAARAAASGSCCAASRIRPGSRTSSWFEPPSHEAIRSGFTKAANRCSGGTTLRDVNARAPAAARPLLERAEPERRRLLKQRHVPLVVGEPAGELAAQRAVHLHVRLVALGHAQQARAQREERPVWRKVAPVVEIPAEDSHWQSTSLPERSLRPRSSGGSSSARSSSRPIACPRARLTARASRSCSTSRPRARVSRSRPACSSSAGTR